MNDKKVLALMYDFYNEHTLHAQNEDINYYLNQIKKYNAKNVLIVGAGTGRVAIPLSKAAHVTALDFDQERLNILKSKANDIETVCVDFIDYMTDRIYDLIIAPYSTFQFVSGNHNINNFFKKLYDIMGAKTIAIFDVSEGFNSKIEKNKELIVKDYCNELNDNVEIYYTSRRFNEFMEFLIEYRLCSKNVSFIENEKYFYYNKEEFLRYANDNDLEIIKIDDGYNGKDYKHKHLYHCKKIK